MSRIKRTMFCLIIFAILILVHGFEAIFLRMDETILGENLINKVFGIVMIIVILKLMNMKGEDIGFKKGLFGSFGAKSIGLGVGYIILAGMMGIKWGLLYKMTGILYAGMADHFFNNCIATNLLHITTESGTDEMMIVRVMIAQLLSFITVIIISKINTK